MYEVKVKAKATLVEAIHMQSTGRVTFLERLGWTRLDGRERGQRRRACWWTGNENGKAHMKNEFPLFMSV